MSRSRLSSAFCLDRSHLSVDARLSAASTRAFASSETKWADATACLALSSVVAAPAAASLVALSVTAARAFASSAAACISAALAAGFEVLREVLLPAIGEGTTDPAIKRGQGPLREAWRRGLRKADTTVMVPLGGVLVVPQAKA